MKIDTLIDQLAHQRKLYGNVDLTTWGGLIKRVTYTPAVDGIVNHDPRSKPNELSLDFEHE